MSAFPSDLKLVQGRLISAALAAALICIREVPLTRDLGVWSAGSVAPPSRPAGKGSALLFGPLSAPLAASIAYVETVVPARS